MEDTRGHDGIGFAIHGEDNIKDVYIFRPMKDGSGDGIRVHGVPEHISPRPIVTITHSNISFSDSLSFDEMDENFSVVEGGEVYLNDVIISDGKKLALIGNGDHFDLDSNYTRVVFANCKLEYGGRRFPEAQDGVTVIMRNCIIRNWGLKRYFDVRAFGAWAHHKARITFENCHFEQKSFFQTGFINFFKDIINHLGQAINDRGILGLTWKDFIPGVCRGAIATDQGIVNLINCTKNKWWIYAPEAKLVK